MKDTGQLNSSARLSQEPKKEGGGVYFLRVVVHSLEMSPQRSDVI